MSTVHIKARQKGFTLLEVLVAVAIFAIAGGAIFRAVSEHINSVNFLRDMTFATYVANNRLAESMIENRNTWPPRNNLRGQSKMGEGTYYWTQTVIKTQDEALKLVTIKVYRDESRERQITEVSSFLAKEAM